jgi:hypothetical protein
MYLKACGRNTQVLYRGSEEYDDKPHESQCSVEYFHPSFEFSAAASVIVIPVENDAVMAQCLASNFLFAEACCLDKHSMFHFSSSNKFFVAFLEVFWPA